MLPQILIKSFPVVIENFKYDVSFCSLSGNKGLCGLPSLPKCPLLWGKNGLSNAGKVGIGLSCLVIVSSIVLGVYYFCIRRRNNHYDFALPHELACKYLRAATNINANFTFTLCNAELISFELVLYYSTLCKKKQIPKAEITNDSRNGKPTRERIHSDIRCQVISIFCFFFFVNSRREHKF